MLPTNCTDCEDPKVLFLFEVNNFKILYIIILFILIISALKSALIILIKMN
jgi:hypothetical protein